MSPGGSQEAPRRRDCLGRRAERQVRRASAKDAPHHASVEHVSCAAKWWCGAVIERGNKFLRASIAYLAVLMQVRASIDARLCINRRGGKAACVCAQAAASRRPATTPWIAGHGSKRETLSGAAPCVTPSRADRSAHTPAQARSLQRSTHAAVAAGAGVTGAPLRPQTAASGSMPESTGPESRRVSHPSHRSASHCRSRSEGLTCGRSRTPSAGARTVAAAKRCSPSFGLVTRCAAEAP